MKKVIYFILLTLVLASCGVDSNHFKIEGRFLNLNQGEFYVYSPDGGLDGVDTIKIEGGRFAYEIPCEKEATLMLVFPNFSEQPIFANPGESVDIKADASHLKELEATGTKDNELMNDFRKQIASASPPEMVKYAGMFIKDHPESPVSVYLVRKYFIASTTPDYKQAMTYIDLMMKRQTRNGYLTRMYERVKYMEKATVGGRIPSFSGYATNGQSVSDNTVSGASLAVISVWASWSFESMDMQRQLKDLQHKSHGRLKVVSICVDGTKDDCKETMDRDSISWPNVCDGLMLEGPIMKSLGLFYVPDNIILQNGRIIARGLGVQQLRTKLESMI
jgi:hypothetical protein